MTAWWLYLIELAHSWLICLAHPGSTLSWLGCVWSA